MTANPARTLGDELRELWDGRELRDLASAALQYTTTGSVTDWGVPARIDSPTQPVTLGAGLPDPDTLPRRELLDAMQRALAVEDDGPLRYGGGWGFEPLREELATRYTRERGFPVSADWFVVTNGSAGAIDQVCRTLVSPGDVVIAESPTYTGTLRTFRGHQTELHSVDMDDEGMRVDELEPLIESLQRQGKTVKLIYTISTFHNPMGTTLSLDRRQELLRIAARHGIFIIDDDAYGDLWFTEASTVPTLSALSEGHGVITAGSFSKTIATGLRVGWIHARPELLDLVIRMRFEMGNSPLLLRMLHEFVRDGSFDRHLELVRGVYHRKMQALSDGLREHCEPYLRFRQPGGGFFLWAELAEGLDARAVQRAGIEEGVVCVPGVPFFPGGSEPGNHLRLAFSWESEESIVEGTRRLGRACERVASESSATK
jgi:2-aminoadipate transaminase